ncbi:hypothetical protein CRYUN_Cryun26dG0113400 [Craigia yunnanensis]
MDSYFCKLQGRRGNMEGTMDVEERHIIWLWKQNVGPIDGDLGGYKLRTPYSSKAKCVKIVHPNHTWTQPV